MLRTIAAFILSGLVGALSAASYAEDGSPESDSASSEADAAPQGRPDTRPLGFDAGLQDLDTDQRQRMLRFSTFSSGKVPKEYTKAENKVGYTVRGIAEGGKLYATYCRQCHGRLGLGNGNLSQALRPSPAMLAYLVGQPFAVDQYLLWSIAEGGKPFGTAMPAFKEQLTREEIFMIVAYLRAGLPDLEDAPTPKDGSDAIDTDEPDPQTHDVD